jgi:hypothetical protein
MQMNRIAILLFLSCACWWLPVHAQSPDKQRTKVIMQSLAERYAAKKDLSFTVVYRYAAEDKPGIYLDSLHGNFKLNGDRYKYALDSTEFIGTKELSVVLFKADKMIYLAKPSATMQTSNPLALMDSLLWKRDSVDCRVEESGDWQKVVLLFKPGGSIKRIEYLIDKRSGLVTRINNTIDSRQLYDASVRSKVQGAISYVTVEADFLDYREGAFPDSELDPGHYVKKIDGAYVAQVPYESYKIFLANPDL